MSARKPVVVDTAVAVPDALAALAHPAQHGAEHCDHPVGLVAVFGSLERPADRQQRALLRHSPGEGANLLGVDLANRRRPLGVLLDTVGGAGQVFDEALVTDTMGTEKRSIVQVFAVQRVCEPEHERNVGVRPNRPPVSVEEVGNVVSYGADADDLDAGRSPGFEL